MSKNRESKELNVAKLCMFEHCAADILDSLIDVDDQHPIRGRVRESVTEARASVRELLSDHFDLVPFGSGRFPAARINKLNKSLARGSLGLFILGSLGAISMACLVFAVTPKHEAIFPWSSWAARFAYIACVAGFIAAAINLTMWRQYLKMPVRSDDDSRDVWLKKVDDDSRMQKRLNRLEKPSRVAFQIFNWCGTASAVLLALPVMAQACCFLVMK